MVKCNLLLPVYPVCIIIIIIMESGKKKGGGVALYVREKWCNPAHVHVKLGLCPYCLPREFTSAIVITVYILPSADAQGL